MKLYVCVIFLNEKNKIVLLILLEKFAKFLRSHTYSSDVFAL